MKKKIYTIGLLFLFVLTCSVFLFAAPQTDISICYTAESGETIEIFPTDDTFYLPSAVDITKVCFSYEGDIRYGENILKAGETLDLTSAKTTDERGADCYRMTLIFGEKSKEFTFYHDSKIGSVFVQTSIGLSAIDANKNTRDKQAEILILDHLGKTEYSDATAQTNSEIKSRGNATFSYLKKPYQIKLDSKTDLFGMGKSKTWILLANYTDQSALHNALGYMLGDKVGVPYNTQYRFVNLYVDGEYRGMYMLCEKVQIGDNRIEIEDLEKATEKANSDKDLASFPKKTITSGTLIQNSILTKYTFFDGVKSPKDITGGYLVELDFRGEQEPSHFVTDNGNIYVVKSPEYVSKAEMEYIAGLFADMEEAIYSDTGYNRKGVHYSEYIDMDSFASVYTVQELMKNWDAYLGSMFFYKDADQNGETAKIYNGPLWDLDNTLGNIRYDKYFFDDTSYLWAQNGQFQNLPRGFGKNLMEHADFHNTVADKYAIAYSAVQSVLSEDGWLAETVETLSESIVMERTRWAFYDPNGWLLSQYGSKVNNVKFIEFAQYGTPYDDTKETALGFLRYYLSSRAEALLLSIGQKVEEKPSVPPPESSTSSSTQQSTSISTQQSTSTAQSTSNSMQQTTTAQPTDDSMPSAATPVSPVVFSVVFCIMILIFVGAGVFIFIKKRH